MFPKISREIDNWDPRRDETLLHTWLHPWLPVLSDKMESLFIQIRHKFSTILRDWNPLDTKMHEQLSPWRQVFTAKDWDNMMLTMVFPRLQELMESFIVNPRDQDIGNLFHFYFSHGP